MDSNPLSHARETHALTIRPLVPLVAGDLLQVVWVYHLSLFLNLCAIAPAFVSLEGYHMKEKQLLHSKKWSAPSKGLLMKRYLAE